MVRGKPTQWQPPDFDDAALGKEYPAGSIEIIITEHLIKGGSEDARAKAHHRVVSILRVFQLALLQRGKPPDRDIRASLKQVEARTSALLNTVQKLDRLSRRELEDAAGRDRPPARTHAQAIVHQVGKHQVVERFGQENLLDALSYARSLRRWSKRAQRRLTETASASGAPERVPEKRALEALARLWKSTARNRPKPAAGVTQEAQYPKFHAFADAVLGPLLVAFDRDLSVAALSRDAFHLTGTAAEPVK